MYYNERMIAEEIKRRKGREKRKGRKGRKRRGEKVSKIYFTCHTLYPPPSDDTKC